jgi:hypothetical protein
VSFLLSTPQTGVDSTLVAAGLLGWPFAVLKILVAALVGVFGGLVAGWLPQPSAAARVQSPADAPQPAAQQGQHEQQKQPALRHTWSRSLRFVADDVFAGIWLWLLFGIAASAALVAWVPADAWPVASSGWGLMASFAGALIVSLPLYVCATASVPIAAGLVAAGMPTGAAMVFLFAGPATNLATMGAVRAEFGWRVTMWYITVLVVGSVLGGLSYEWMFGQLTVPAMHMHDGHDHQHDDDASWLQLVAIAVLGLFLLRYAWQRGSRAVLRAVGHATKETAGCCSGDSEQPASACCSSSSQPGASAPLAAAAPVASAGPAANCCLPKQSCCGGAPTASATSSTTKSCCGGDG